MSNERKNITQPADWWAAWLERAKSEGKTLSAWIGEQCNQGLAKSTAKKLSERPPAHRPKQTT